MSRAEHSRSSSAGFTMTELLVTMIISLMLSTSGWLFFRTQLRFLTDQSASLDAIEGTRAALDFMANEIRMAGSNAAGTSRWNPAANSCQAGLSAARSDNLTLTWDDGDAGKTAPDVTVTYAYDATNKQITRTAGGTTSPLISNVPVGGLSFQYFISDGNAAAMSGSPAQVTTAACDNVTLLVASVTVQTARGVTITNVNLGSRVALRNRILGRI